MSRHLLIAGTGRAGTSFLVRYLTRLGLDTNLSRGGAQAFWDDRANAGLEDMPLADPGELPYVVKSPWTYQYIEELLAAPALTIDAVIIPMRDLVQAASSRSIVEMQAMHSHLPWLSERTQSWEHFTHTPGGAVFSTSPVDQARLLAVGFHHLLDKLVEADIPVVLLSFPRFIEDADYLFSKLAPVLPRTISPELGRAAHAETADVSKVRVETEIRNDVAGPGHGLALHGPGHAALDRAAMARELTKTRHAAQAEIERLRRQIDRLRATPMRRAARVVARFMRRLPGAGAVVRWLHVHTGSVQT